MKSTRNARGKDKDFLMNALDMLYFHAKRLNLPKITIILVLLSLWNTTSHSTNAVITADWGDVVDIQYQRYDTAAYLDPPAEDDSIRYVYLTIGDDVPSEILALYPSANARLILGFKEGIIGLAENQVTEFQTADVYDGEGYLYFRITLVKIWYDAFIGETSETTSTPTTTTKRNPGGIDTLTILGGGLGIITVSVLFWGFSNQRRRQKVLGQDSTSTVSRERSIKHKKTQLKELRELAESHSSDTDVKGPSKTDVKFRRRR
ncbi:MAG: hypothetical protein ACXAC6_18210 [Candidatus Hodarchaeales archaeon]|jgi:hypothetical protein